MGSATTPSAEAPFSIPSAGVLRKLKISPEVAWFMASRGIPFPEFPPLVKAPEPRDAPGALFDGTRVDRVLAAFSNLRHTQGDLAGQPLNPDPWQIAYIIAPTFGWVRQNSLGRYVRIIRNLYVDVPRKNGKGVYVGTMILTRDGWKKFGELKVGDEVHALDGTLTRIIGTSPIRNLECYEVTFADGQSVVCDEEHLWTVWDRWAHDPKAWKESRFKGGAWRTITTPELFAKQRGGSRGDTRYSVHMDRVIQRPEADLPIDPYLLGAWLGDGHTQSAAITSADPEILQAFGASSYELRRIGATEYGYRIKGGFQVALRRLGVLGAKHIPEAYLLASEVQRLALLQGLMDTDGTVGLGSGTPRVEFTTTNKNLAEGVLFLARSLGWKPTIKESRAKMYGRDCGPKWRVTWHSFAHRHRVPFRLERKIARLPKEVSGRRRSSTNTIVKVERVDTVPTMCIAVEHPDRQFLVGEGLIPTHNSSLCGGFAIYLTAADGEPGAQVLAAATTSRQASYVFAPIKQLAAVAPALRGHVKPYQNRIVHPRSNSYFGVVSSVAEALHGANVHGAVIDELHVHKTPDLVEAIETGTGSRSQPLVITITTADDGRPQTIYARKRRYIEQLEKGVFTDAATYGVVFAASESDNPFVEKTWRKANPGYGISPTKESMQDAANKAKNSPAELSAFLRLHLGIRTKQTTRFLDLKAWDTNAGKISEKALAGRDCYGGLDLGNVSDLTALCWLFPSVVGAGYEALWRFWTPEDNLEALDKRSAGAGSLWVSQGWLETTPGNVTDYDFIKARVLADMDTFNVLSIGYDRWNSTQIVNDLVAEDAPMVKVGQGVFSMSPAMKEIQRLTLLGKKGAPMLNNGGNPVMRWMVDNLAVATDPSGNVKPDKANSGDKIDGVSALANAVSEALAADQHRSAYEESDLIIA